MTDVSTVEVRDPEPCAVAIFGASGDLTQRKLIPALWNLQVERRLPRGISIVGVARTPKTDEQFRKEAREAVEEHSRFRQPEAEAWERFAAGLFYLPGQYNDPGTYENLKRLLHKLCEERGTCGNQ